MAIPLRKHFYTVAGRRGKCEIITKKDEKFAFQSPARPDILRANPKFRRYDTPDNTAFRSIVRNGYALDLDARSVPGPRADNVISEFHPWFPVVTKRI